MKRWLSAIIIAVMLITCVLGTYAMAEEAAQKVKTTGSVNVRKGPGLSYKTLGAVKKGVTLEYMGEKKKDDRGVAWYRVNYNGNTNAWISSRYSKLTGKSSGSSSSGSSSSGSSSSGSSSSSAQDAGYGFIKAKAKINIRKGPGTNYSVVSSAKKGQKLTYLGESYKDASGVTWYKVSKGWVSGQYATPMKGAKTVKTSQAAKTEKPDATQKPAATPKPAVSSSYGTVSITSSLNVRIGPGLDFDSIGTVGGGTTLKYHGDSCTDGRGVTWYRVTYEDRDDAWVSSMYAALSADSETVSHGSSAAAAGTVEATAKVNLRVGPGTKNTVASSMKKGQTLDYMGAFCTDETGLEWYMVKISEGRMGWVCADYARLSGSGTFADFETEAASEPVSVWADDTEPADGDTGFDWFTADEAFVDEAVQPDDTLTDGAAAAELSGELAVEVMPGGEGEGYSPWGEAGAVSAAAWDVSALPQMPRIASAASVTAPHPREQIIASLGAANADPFTNAAGFTSSAENGVTTLAATLKDGVYISATEGCAKSWLDINGVFGAFDADLDGDGAMEFVVLYGRAASGESPWKLAVFEDTGAGFVFADELSIDLYEKNERFLRLTALDKGLGVFMGNVNYLDGAACVAAGVVYRYNGSKFLGEAMFSTANVSYSYAVYGKAFTVDAVSTIDAACQGYPYHPAAANELGIIEGETFTPYDLGGYKPAKDPVTGKVHTENFAGLDMVGEKLAYCGVQTGYEIYPADDGTEDYAVILSGGETILSLNEGLNPDGSAFALLSVKGSLLG